MNRRRTPTAALALREAGKRYGEAPALAPLELRIEPGQAVALVGHNGSGKSTLLALAAGVVEPTEGSVSVFGWPPAAVEARALVSYVPDDPVLYDDLSVREHLRYVARLHGGSGDDPLLDELLHRLGLADRADELPSGFSRGLRQKAALAVGLCRPFRLLLVDEPFVGLDAAGRDAFVALAGEAVDRGAALVVATHDPALLPRLDRCIELVDGAVAFDGTPEQRTSR